jgi:ABC-type antimicrobial peptide transport system permease subunit
MFIFYFKSAWKTFTHRKGYNLLNIIGLSTGLAACLVIFLILQHEFSYDRYHKNADRVYQLASSYWSPAGQSYQISAPFDAARALRHDYPQVKFTEIYITGSTQITVMKNASSAGDQKYIEDRVFYAEPALFNLFDVQWLSGDASVLANDNSVVLSRGIAEKYFGRWQEATGKYIRLDNKITVQVAGIISDPPGNTDYSFQVVSSYQSFLNNHKAFNYDQLYGWGWSVTNHQVYALVPEKTDVAALNKNLAGFLPRYYKQDTSMEKTVFFIRPLSEVHFDTRFANNGDHTSSKSSLYTLGLIALLILAMACTNFVNLSTALSMQRSKEVGVRKVMGGTRWQLVLQTLADTGVVVFISLAIALLLASLCLPYVKYVSQVEQPLRLLSGATLFFLPVIWIATTLLAGIYPALQLSHFSPINTLRFSLTGPRVGGLFLRRILVVLQFSSSQLLVIATLVALSQMNFIRKADMGVTRDTVVLVKGVNDSSFLSNRGAFRDELGLVADVRSVSMISDAPPSGQGWDSDFGYDNIQAPQSFFVRLKFGDASYGKTFGLKMAAGEWYPENDTAGQAVINETLAHKLVQGDVGKIIGKKIRVGEGKWRTITGVVRDFKNASLKEGIPPNIIIQNKRFQMMTAIRLRSNNPGRSLAGIEKVWKKYFPEHVFNSTFMDEDIEKFYRQEQRLSITYNIATVLAILISCLGLYGLVSFMALQKTKEVGIRKVLGATIADIVYLFSKEFTILVGIAFLIAAPVGYWLMQRWLQNFVYRIEISPGIFFATLFISMGLAWVSVGYKSIGAAMVNPAKSLKTE